MRAALRTSRVARAAGQRWMCEGRYVHTSRPGGLRLPDSHAIRSLRRPFRAVSGCLSHLLPYRAVPNANTPPTNTSLSHASPYPHPHPHPHAHPPSSWQPSSTLDDIPGVLTSGNVLKRLQSRGAVPRPGTSLVGGDVHGRAPTHVTNQKYSERPLFRRGGLDRKFNNGEQAAELLIAESVHRYIRNRSKRGATMVRQ